MNKLIVERMKQPIPRLAANATYANVNMVIAFDIWIWALSIQGMANRVEFFTMMRDMFASHPVGPYLVPSATIFQLDDFREASHV